MGSYSAVAHDDLLLDSSAPLNDKSKLGEFLAEVFNEEVMTTICNESPHGTKST